MFLKRIYKEWKLLFWVVVLFMFAQLFFMAKAIENVPFFLYHMYSKAHQPKDSTAVYLIKTPKGYFNHKTLSSREQEMLMNSVLYYVNLSREGDGIKETVKKRFGRIVNATGYNKLEQQLSNDDLSLEKFPQWWGKYFQSVSGSNYDSVSVIKSFVYSQSPYSKSEIDSLIFTVKLK